MMQANRIDRRKALAVVAAVPATVAFGSTSAVGGPSELAALVQRYFAEVEVFNSTGFDAATGKYRSDRASHALAKRTFEATMWQMKRTPVRTSEDALALLDWMERENIIEAWCGDCEGFTEALVDNLRDYLAGRVA